MALASSVSRQLWKNSLEVHDNGDEGTWSEDSDDEEVDPHPKLIVKTSTIQHAGDGLFLASKHVLPGKVLLQARVEMLGL